MTDPTPYETHPDQGPARQGLTHPLDVSYLVVGLVLLGIAATWALRAADVVDVDQLGWLLPLVLVAAGVVGLVAFTAKGLSNRRQERAASPEQGMAFDEDDRPTDDTAPLG